jgi:hypothetical protein
MIQSSLTYSSSVWPKRVTEELIDAFYQKLKAFTDDSVYTAFKKYHESDDDNDDKFPSPSRIKKLIPTGNYFDELNNDKFHMVMKMRCQIPGCFKTDVCIREPNQEGVKYKCRDCYSGLTLEQRNQRMRDIMHMIRDKNFKPLWVKSGHVN